MATTIQELWNTDQFDVAFNFAQTFSSEYDRYCCVALTVDRYILSEWDFDKAMSFANQIPSQSHYSYLRERTFASIATAIVSQERFGWVRRFDTHPCKPQNVRFNSTALQTHHYVINLHQSIVSRLSQYLQEGQYDRAKATVDCFRESTADIKSLDAMLPRV